MLNLLVLERLPRRQPYFEDMFRLRWQANCNLLFESAKKERSENLETTVTKLTLVVLTYLVQAVNHDEPLLLVKNNVILVNRCVI